MTTRQALGAIGLALLIGVACGRYTLPAKIVTKTVVTTDSSKHESDHSVVVRTETRKPDGTDTIITTTQKNVTNVSTADTTSLSSKAVTYDTERWELLGVAGLDLRGAPAYGAEINYRLLGPVTIGAMGLTSGFVGVSVGLRF